jgi:nucleotide sugar dehydrogenase
MESSVYVGMTRKVIGHLRAKNIYIGFSPERVDPGRVDPLVYQIPKIISGIDEESLCHVMEFYGSVFEKLVPVSSMETAEMCKLAENCFRMINITYANEISDACKKLNINPYEMTNACATKPFGFMPFYAGLGVGGHCIPVNPQWLAITSKDDLPLLMSATKMTKERPIREAKKLLENPYIHKVLVVGMAFKTGESLTTKSAGLDFANYLFKHNIDVSFYDPLVSIDDASVKHLKRVTEITTEYLDTSFDAVCISIKQTGIGW